MLVSRGQKRPGQGLATIASFPGLPTVQILIACSKLHTAKPQATWLKDKQVREYIDGNFSLTTTQKENMIDTVHTNIHNTTLAIYINLGLSLDNNEEVSIRQCVSSVSSLLGWVVTRINIAIAAS